MYLWLQEEFPWVPVLVSGCTLAVSLGCLGLGVGAITSMDFLFSLCRFTTSPELINYVMTIFSLKDLLFSFIFPLQGKLKKTRWESLKKI